MAGPRGQQHGRRPSNSHARLFLVAVCVICIALLRNHAWQATLEAEGVTAGRSAASERRDVPAIEFLERAAAYQAPGYPRDVCERWQGLGYIRQMRSTMQPLCWPQGGSSPASLLLCSFQRDETYSEEGLPEAYCAGSNLALDLRKLQALFGSDPPVETLKGGARAYVQEQYHAAGSLLGSCTMREPGSAAVLGAELPALRQQHPLLRHLSLNDTEGAGWKEPSFGKGGQLWLFRNFQAAPQGTTQPKCVSWVAHPLYFLADRWEPHNVWHGLEDVAHAFEAYSLLGWGQDAQVVVIDAPDRDRMWEHVAYGEVWRRVFSPRHEPTTLKSLVNDAVRAHKGALPEGAALCFREGAWAVHGGLSILSRNNGARSPCTNSTMFNALVSFILDRLELTDVRPASHAAIAPDPGSANSQGAAGVGSQAAAAAATEAAAGGGATGAAAAARAKARPLLNVVWALRTDREGRQEDVLNVLRERLGPAGGQLAAVDFGTLGMSEQLRTVRGADVLVGYHGAALTLSLFMREESALVEIQAEYRCHCYINAAIWRDRPHYLLVDSPEEGFPEEVFQAVAAAVDLVAQRIAAAKAGVPAKQLPRAPSQDMGR